MLSLVAILELFPEFNTDTKKTRQYRRQLRIQPISGQVNVMIINPSCPSCMGRRLLLQ